jgi:ribonucleoside-diphosphate reductase alpha chain
MSSVRKESQHIMYYSDHPVGPQVPSCERTHAEKHRLPGESFREAVNRQAAALKDNDQHFHEFREILLDQRFAGGGRIQASMGSGRNTTAYNCFVGGDIADSFVDDPGSIMQRASEAAATMRMGGGLGNNFSSLRPNKALIKKLGSHSAGPLPFIDIFNSIGVATSSSGHRRGAQMAVLNIDHPDIFDFIHAKQNKDKFTGFNFSVGITDKFMEAKYANKPFALQFGGQVYREVDPHELWETLMRSTWDWGEPGALFLDTINRMNPLWYCETLLATNPCGEQPLPPFGACLLGSFNLVRYIYRDFGGAYAFDWAQLEKDIPHVVRAMDNVVDRSRYPLRQQELEAKNKRRMGLGVTGLANAGEALGFAYGNAEFITFEEKVLDTIRDWSYAASALLAREKGTFPLYVAKDYRQGKFFQTLSPWVQELIKQNGLRNSHLLSVAPTGTMSYTLDNVSSGIEPVFSYEQERDILDNHGKRTEIIQDYGVRVFGVTGKRCADVTIDEHLAVLAAASKRVDSAVSKTCNVSPTMPWNEFKSIYDKAYALGCKGITTFNPGGKRFGVLRSADKLDQRIELRGINQLVTSVPKNDVLQTEVLNELTCTFDFASGRKSCE